MAVAAAVAVAVAVVGRTKDVESMVHVGVDAAVDAVLVAALAGDKGCENIANSEDCCGWFVCVCCGRGGSMCCGDWFCIWAAAGGEEGRERGASAEVETAAALVGAGATCTGIESMVAVGAEVIAVVEVAEEEAGKISSEAVCGTACSTTGAVCCPPLLLCCSSPSPSPSPPLLGSTSEDKRPCCCCCDAAVVCVVGRRTSPILPAPPPPSSPAALPSRCVCGGEAAAGRWMPPKSLLTELETETGTASTIRQPPPEAVMSRISSPSDRYDEASVKAPGPAPTPPS